MFIQFCPCCSHRVRASLSLPPCMRMNRTLQSTPSQAAYRVELRMSVEEASRWEGTNNKFMFVRVRAVYGAALSNMCAALSRNVPCLNADELGFLATLTGLGSCMAWTVRDASVLHGRLSTRFEPEYDEYWVLSAYTHARKSIKDVLHVVVRHTCSQTEGCLKVRDLNVSDCRFLCESLWLWAVQFWKTTARYRNCGSFQFCLPKHSMRKLKRAHTVLGDKRFAAGPFILHPPLCLLSERILMCLQCYAYLPCVCSKVCRYSWTFEDVSQVASYILSQRVIFQDKPVILWCRCPSNWIVAAVVACLAAGAPFLVVSDQPPSRVQELFSVLQCQTLIYIGMQEKEDNPQAICPTSLVISPARLKPPQSPDLVEHACYRRPADPCRVLFYLSSSGSTGHPKVIPIHDAMATSHVHWFGPLNPLHPLRPGDVFGHVHNPDFDMFTLCLLASLSAGSCCAFLRDSYLNFDSIQAAIRIGINHVTHLSMTPTMYKSLFVHKYLWSFLRNVHTLWMAGEPCDVSYLRCDEWFSYGMKGTFINLYGPAEASFISWYNVHPATDFGKSPREIPLGLCIDCNVIRYHNAMPTLEPFNLKVLGRGVAEQYTIAPPGAHNRFFRDPNGVQGFDTGDLVRIGWHERAQRHMLYYVCRTNSEVKVNSIRVDLVDLEAQLQSTLSNVCVAVQYNESVDRLLIHTCPNSVDQVERFLLDHFCHALRDATEVLLCDSQDLVTGNGKRKRIVQSHLDSTSKRTQELARSEQSGDPAECIAEITGVPTIDTNFFVAGFKSMDVVFVVERINLRLKKRVTVADFYRHQTPRLLARAIASEGALDQNSVRFVPSCEWFVRNGYRVDIDAGVAEMML